MEVIYNGQGISEKEMKLSFQDRAFQYGDGLFETIILKNGNIRFLPYHLDRLGNGMNILGYEPAAHLSLTRLREYILHLVQINRAEENARIKLQVWRGWGGLYAPENNKANFLISAIAVPPQKPLHLNKVSFSQNVKLSHTLTSSLKTINCLPYILAGLEKKERVLDEIILLDQQGHIAECGAANIFWIKNGVFYTPSLKTGCVAGVMRRHILERCREKAIQVIETTSPKEELLKAEAAFTCNVAGLNMIKSIDHKELGVANLSFLDEIIE